MIRVSFWHDDEERQLWEHMLPTVPSMGDLIVFPSERQVAVKLVEWNCKHDTPSVICHVAEVWW